MIALLLAALSVLPTSPGRSVQRNVGWLDPWATATIQAQSGAQFVLRSTHDAEDAMADTSPEHPMMMHATWTWHGATITLDVPRLSSELATDEGDAHYYERFARQVTRAQLAMPPDRLVFMLLRGRVIPAGDMRGWKAA